MSTPCQPSDLVSNARCFTCVPKQARRSVLTYLLCQWANKTVTVPSNTNLIPPGAAYGGFIPSQYCLRNPGPLTVGATYRFTSTDPTYVLSLIIFLGASTKTQFNGIHPGNIITFVSQGDGFCVSNLSYLLDPLVLATLVYVSGP